MFAVGLSYMTFITLRYVPSMPAFWRIFIINGCWVLSKAFSASIEIIIWFLSSDPGAPRLASPAGSLWAASTPAGSSPRDLLALPPSPPSSHSSGCKEDVGTLGRCHSTRGNLSIVHLVPLAISSSHATNVMSLVTAPPRVDQHSIEHIIQGSYFLLRHVQWRIKTSRISHLLVHFVPCEIWEPL